MKIVELFGAAAMHDVAALFDRTWRAGPTQPVIDASTLQALAYTGNYVAGAYDGDVLVGASVGFFAADGHLHSHITGVAPGYQGRGVGRTLKQHQREWALARGCTSIGWTFDPLIARNAYFNLHTLGAVAVEYLPDFYGEMNDDVNAGDATDRLYVLWSPDRQPPRAVHAAGIPALLDRENNAPRTGTPGGDRVTVAMPLDIEKLRADEPTLAVRWRMAVREALTNSDYRITGITRDGRYVLEVRT